jgi:small-conductance mechanosensitive channel
VRPSPTRSRVRTVGALSLLAATAACGWWGGDGAGPPEDDPAGSSPAAEIVDAMPVTSQSGGAVAQGSTADTAAAGAEIPTPGAPSPGADTTGQAGGDLQARVTRLEAVNDSLRNTILGLVALQANRAAPSRPDTGSASAQTSEIIGEGADTARNWGLRIIIGLLFLALVGIAVRLVVWVLAQLAERSAKRRLFFKRLGPIIRIVLWGLGVLFVALIIVDVDPQGLLAAGAAGGVALGIAAQDILKNVFGGLIVLFDQPFQVGDKISVGGSYGEVVSIGLRSTRIVTPDDNTVTVPNAQVVEGQVSNANSGELNCQVVTDLWLPGWVDEAKAKEIAFEAASSSRYVFLNKPIVVLVKDEFDHIFLTHIKVKAYVLDPRHEFVFMSDVTERARAGFREAGLLPEFRSFQGPGGYDPMVEARWAWEGIGPHAPREAGPGVSDPRPLPDTEGEDAEAPTQVDA